MKVRNAIAICRTQKKRAIKWMIFLVLMAIVLMIYLVTKRIIFQNFRVIEDDFSWVYQIDAIKEENDKLLVSGFAFKLGEDSQEENCEVILQNIKTGKRHFPQMNFRERKDVNNYFLCEFDYTESGFEASFNSINSNSNNEVYEIIIRPADEVNAYATGIYYTNGQVLYVNPEEFEALETAGSDLEKITNDGILRVYCPDSGIFVYQYAGALYWIAEKEYDFVNEDFLVQFQLETTQIERLPEHRLANNWFWSNLGFQFRTNELTEKDTGKYRVTKAPLPTEYSITRIETGHYADGWIWRAFFRPWYEFVE